MVYCAFKGIVSCAVVYCAWKGIVYLAGIYCALKGIVYHTVIVLADRTHLRGQNVYVDPVTRREQEEKRRKHLEYQVCGQATTSEAEKSVVFASLKVSFPHLVKRLHRERGRENGWVGGWRRNMWELAEYFKGWGDVIKCLSAFLRPGQELRLGEKKNERKKIKKRKKQEMEEGVRSGRNTT